MRVILNDVCIEKTFDKLNLSIESANTITIYGFKKQLFLIHHLLLFSINIKIPTNKTNLSVGIILRNFNCTYIDLKLLLTFY